MDLSIRFQLLENIPMTIVTCMQGGTPQPISASTSEALFIQNVEKYAVSTESNMVIFNSETRGEELLMSTPMTLSST